MQRGHARASSHGAAAAAILVALALAGCGGDDEPRSDTDDGARRDSAESSTAAAEPGLSPAPGSETAPEPPKPEAGLSPQTRVDLAIKGVLASAVPQLACRRYATEHYVKKVFGNRQGCQRSTVPASAAAYVKVSWVEIEGDKATARALPSGGPSDGEKIDVELVRQRGIWKVDSLRSNVPVGP